MYGQRLSIFFVRWHGWRIHASFAVGLQCPITSPRFVHRSVRLDGLRALNATQHNLAYGILRHSPEEQR